MVRTDQWNSVDVAYYGLKIQNV